MPVVSWPDVIEAASKLGVEIETDLPMNEGTEMFLTEVEKTPAGKEGELDPMVVKVYNDLVGNKEKNIAPAKVVNHPDQTDEEIAAIMAEEGTEAPETAATITEDEGDGPPETPEPKAKGKGKGKAKGEGKAKKEKAPKKPKEPKEKKPSEPGYRQLMMDAILAGKSKEECCAIVVEAYRKKGEVSTRGEDWAKKRALRIYGDMLAIGIKEGKVIAKTPADLKKEAKAAE